MKTMIKISAAAALLAATAAPAFADALTVDLARVFSDSAAGKSGTAQLKAKYNSQLQQKNQAFTTAAQAYQSQVNSARAAAKPGVPTPQATITAVNQAGERAQAAQDALNQLGQEVQAAEGYVRQQIVEHVGPIAEQVRAERKADVVVPKSSTLAADPAGDVTTLVLQRLDASFPTPSIVLPQQGAAPAAAAPAQPATPQGR